MNRSTFYIGSYTIPSPWAPSAGHGEGIVSAVLNERSGAMESIDIVSQVNPAFLAHDQTRNLIFAVTETQTGGLIASYRPDASGRLSLVGEAPTGADAPCHVSVSPSGDLAVVSHYHGGVATCVRLDSKGAPKSVVGRVVSPGVIEGEDRSAAPVHMHACLFLTATDMVLVDSGRGLLMLFDLGDDPVDKELCPKQVLRVPIGCEPRHVAHRPGDDAIYVSNQADSSASVIGLDGATGSWRLSLQSVVPTKGLGRRRPIPSEIAIHPTQPVVYMANRFDDSITVFQVVDGGQLELVASVDVLGKYPRHFAVSPSGAFLLVAGQDSNQVHSLSIAPDGLQLEWTGHILPTGSPSCICF